MNKHSSFYLLIVCTQKRRNKLLIYTIAWKNLVDLILRKRRQIHKSTYTIILFTWHFRSCRTNQGDRTVVTLRRADNDGKEHMNLLSLVQKYYSFFCLHYGNFLWFFITKIILWTLIYACDHINNKVKKKERKKGNIRKWLQCQQNNT